MPRLRADALRAKCNDADGLVSCRICANRVEGYGPPYPDELQDKLRACESCIKGGRNNVAIANAGYPCAAARCCVNDIHT